MRDTAASEATRDSCHLVYVYLLIPSIIPEPLRNRGNKRTRNRPRRTWVYRVEPEHPSMTRRGLNTRTNSRWCPSNSARFSWLMFMMAVSAVSGWAQTQLSPEFHLRYTDMSVLASRERRADFSCHVTTDRPALGFDLRFHSDYRDGSYQSTGQCWRPVADGYTGYAVCKQRGAGLPRTSVLGSRPSIGRKVGGCLGRRV